MVRRLRDEGVAVGEAAVEIGLGRLEGEQRADSHAVSHLGAQPALLEAAQHLDDPLASRRKPTLPAALPAPVAVAAASTTLPALSPQTLTLTITALPALPALLPGLGLLQSDRRRERRIGLGTEALDRGVACGGEGRGGNRTVL